MKDFFISYNQANRAWAEWIDWELEEDTPVRGGHPRRRFTVTRQGIAALRAARETLLGLWDGLEQVLR